MPVYCNRFFDNVIPPPLDFADLTKLLCGRAGGGMQKSREPDTGLKGYQSALDLTARVGAAVVAMVGPGLAGQWLDQRWGTGFLALLGFLFGIPFGIYYLLLMSGTLPPKWGKVPEHRSRRETPPNADHASDRDTPQPPTSDE
jgi:hypothetical protein